MASVSCVRLAGLETPTALVLKLTVMMLRCADYAHTADMIGDAVGADRPDLALTILDRAAILRVLDDPPVGLAQLRAVLLQEQVGRVRDGIA